MEKWLICHKIPKNTFFFHFLLFWSQKVSKLGHFWSSGTLEIKAIMAEGIWFVPKLTMRYPYLQWFHCCYATLSRFLPIYIKNSDNRCLLCVYVNQPRELIAHKYMTFFTKTGGRHKGNLLYFSSWDGKLLETYVVWYEPIPSFWYIMPFLWSFTLNIAYI